MRLKDKVAVVTGGAQGLGKAFCLRLSEEGCKVVIADVDFESAKRLEKEIVGEKGEALAIETDVSSEESTQRMAEVTISKFARIDILINNAGIYPPKPWTEISVEEWDKVLAINLKGCFLCAKAVFPQMKKQRKGKIINISSETFFTGAPNLLHYVSSKGGIIGFTRALASEVGEFGINVNAITPGLTQTGTVKRQFPQEFIEQNAQQQCIIKRPEQPEDLVGTIIFLSSEDSDFITGQTINVDGGLIKY